MFVLVSCYDHCSSELTHKVEGFGPDPEQLMLYLLEVVLPRDVKDPLHHTEVIELEKEGSFTRGHLTIKVDSSNGFENCYQWDIMELRDELSLKDFE